MVCQEHGQLTGFNSTQRLDFPVMIAGMLKVEIISPLISSIFSIGFF